MAASRNDDAVFTTACAGARRRNSSPQARYSTPSPAPAAVEKREHHGCVKKLRSMITSTTVDTAMTAGASARIAGARMTRAKRFGPSAPSSSTASMPTLEKPTTLLKWLTSLRVEKCTVVLKNTMDAQASVSAKPSARTSNTSASVTAFRWALTAAIRSTIPVSMAFLSPVPRARLPRKRLLYRKPTSYKTYVHPGGKTIFSRYETYDSKRPAACLK